ncbi:MAG: hypothetical protein WDW36_009578 [Sanguina aurantia]
MCRHYTEFCLPAGDPSPPPPLTPPPLSPPSPSPSQPASPPLAPPSPSPTQPPTQPVPPPSPPPSPPFTPEGQFNNGAPSPPPPLAQPPLTPPPLSPPSPSPSQPASPPLLPPSPFPTPTPTQPMPPPSPPPSPPFTPEGQFNNGGPSPPPPPTPAVPLSPPPPSPSRPPSAPLVPPSPSPPQPPTQPPLPPSPPSSPPFTPEQGYTIPTSLPTQSLPHPATTPTFPTATPPFPPEQQNRGPSPSPSPPSLPIPPPPGTPVTPPPKPFSPPHPPHPPYFPGDFNDGGGPSPSPTPSPPSPSPPPPSPSPPPPPSPLTPAAPPPPPVEQVYCSFLFNNDFDTTVAHQLSKFQSDGTAVMAQLWRVNISDINAVSIARGSVVFDYTTMSDPAYAHRTRSALSADALSSVRGTNGGSQFLSNYGITTVGVGFDRSPPPPPPDLATQAAAQAAQAKVVQLATEATTLKTVTAVSLSAAATASTISYVLVSSAASQAVTALGSTASEVALSTALASAGIENLMVRLQAFVLSGTMVVRVSDRFANFAAALEWLNFQVDIGVTGTNSTVANFATTIYNNKHVSYLTKIANGGSDSAARHAVWVPALLRLTCILLIVLLVFAAHFVVLKSWMHLPYGWCYTPLPDFLVFPKLELWVIAATIPGAAQAAAMLISGAIVAPSLRTSPVIGLAVASALYVLAYLAAICWLLLKLMQERHKYGIVYIYPQQTPDLTKQSLFTRTVVYGRMHGTWDSPVLATRKENEPARTRHYCRTHVNLASLFRLLKGRTREDTNATQPDGAMSSAEDGNQASQPLPDGMLLRASMLLQLQDTGVAEGDASGVPTASANASLSDPAQQFSLAESSSTVPEVSEQYGPTALLHPDPLPEFSECPLFETGSTDLDTHLPSSNPSQATHTVTRDTGRVSEAVAEATEPCAAEGESSRALSRPGAASAQPALSTGPEVTVVPLNPDANKGVSPFSLASSPTLEAESPRASEHASHQTTALTQPPAAVLGASTDTQQQQQQRHSFAHSSTSPASLLGSSSTPLHDQASIPETAAAAAAAAPIRTSQRSGSVSPILKSLAAGKLPPLLRGTSSTPLVFDHLTSMMVQQSAGSAAQSGGSVGQSGHNSFPGSVESPTFHAPCTVRCSHSDSEMRVPALEAPCMAHTHGMVQTSTPPSQQPGMMSPANSGRQTQAPPLEQSSMARSHSIVEMPPHGGPRTSSGAVSRVVGRGFVSASSVGLAAGPSDAVCARQASREVAQTLLRRPARAASEPTPERTVRQMTPLASKEVTESPAGLESCPALWHDEEWEFGEESLWAERDLAHYLQKAEKAEQRAQRTEGSGSNLRRAKSAGAPFVLGATIVRFLGMGRKQSSPLAESEAAGVASDATIKGLSAAESGPMPDQFTTHGGAISRGNSSQQQQQQQQQAKETDGGVELSGEAAGAAGRAVSVALGKFQGEMKLGSGELTMGRVERRPLPMVALELEQRLGDLFADYKASCGTGGFTDSRGSGWFGGWGHHPTTSMFKVVDTLNMILTAAVAGIITGIAPEVGSLKAFYTALATLLVQAVFALVATLLLPNLDKVAMFTTLGSQWFLSGASLIVVLQQIEGAQYSEHTAQQLEAGRANLAFVSALFSAAGMCLALLLKFVDFRADRKEQAEMEGDEGMKDEQR